MLIASANSQRSAASVRSTTNDQVCPTARPGWRRCELHDCHGYLASASGVEDSLKRRSPLSSSIRRTLPKPGWTVRKATCSGQRIRYARMLNTASRRWVQSKVNSPFMYSLKILR